MINEWSFGQNTNNEEKAHILGKALKLTLRKGITSLQYKKDLTLIIQIMEIIQPAKLAFLHYVLKVLFGIF